MGCNKFVPLGQKQCMFCFKCQALIWHDIVLDPWFLTIGLILYHSDTNLALFEV